MAKRGYVRSIYLSGEDAEQLLEMFMKIAKREGLSFNQAIKKAMEEYVERHGGGNPAFPLDRWVEDEEFVVMPTLGEKPNPELVKKLPDDLLQELRYHAYLWYELAGQEENRRRYERGVR